MKFVPLIQDNTARILNKRKHAKQEAKALYFLELLVKHAVGNEDITGAIKAASDYATDLATLRLRELITDLHDIKAVQAEDSVKTIINRVEHNEEHINLAQKELNDMRNITNKYLTTLKDMITDIEIDGRLIEEILENLIVNPANLN